jgi:ABC-2 type transport system permease protein
MPPRGSPSYEPERIELSKILFKMKSATSISQEPVLLPAILNSQHDAAVLQRLRWRQWRNSLSELWRHSSLRVFVILFVSLLIWSFVFGISAEAMYYLRRQGIPLHLGILGAILDMLFLFLTVGLIASSGLILYGSLFASEETAFLLTTPAPADQVFAYKFQGAMAFSSWGFLLLGTPVLVAYGFAFSVPAYFYLFILLFFLGFVLVPGSIGALGCLLIMSFLPRRRKQVVYVALGLAAVGFCIWMARVQPANWEDALNRDFVEHLLDQFAFAQSPASPNHWMSRGLQAAAQGDLTRTFYYLLLVWSNGLFLYVLTTWVARRLYRHAYNGVASGGTLRRRYGGHWLDRGLNRMVAFLNPQTRLLIIKDFRTFRRDPAQWAQVLVFSAIMILYFANMRQFFQGDFGRSFQNGISQMNLAATALLMCAYTGRFIYPMLSLEGRKFWVLGLLPLKRDRLLWGKFAFSATWSLLIAEFLVVFSDLMLGMPAWIVGLHALTVLVLALGLSGLSVGLGAWMPSFKESDPSKIAVGFGGTVNLVVGLLYLVLILVLMSVPLHLHYAALDLGPDSRMEYDLARITVWWLRIGLALGLALGAAAVVLPLRLGTRALRRMEF